MQFHDAGRLYEAYIKAPVSQKIHPADVMFKTGAPWYFKAGQSAIQVIFSGLGLSWLTKVERVLDLPCGHGRVARQLRAAFPKAKLFFCDIDTEGADFCAAEFGGTAIHSEPDLTSVELPRDLDLIWVGSLFTHLDQERTAAWLAYLVDHLRDEGIIVASFHGLFLPGMMSEQREIDGASMQVINDGFANTGWGYDSYSGTPEYGFARSHPATVLRMATDIPGTRVVSYVERGWSYNHDILVLAKQDRLEEFASIAKRYPPKNDAPGPLEVNSPPPQQPLEMSPPPQPSRTSAPQPRKRSQASRFWRHLKTGKF